MSHRIARTASALSLGTAVALLAAPPTAAAQAPGQSPGARAIAARVAAAPDGEVRLTYATRAGVCGDGADVVALGRSLTVYPSMESYGSWSGVRCAAGPAQVTLTVRAHAVESLRTRIGAASRTGGTDLGVVSAAGAADYLLGLARTLDGRDARNAVLPAVVADSAAVVPPLLALASDTSVARPTRRRAVHWAGLLGDASTVAPLERLARDADESIGEAALFGLSSLPDGVGIPSLVSAARSGTPDRLREKAVFWLGQADREDATRVVRAIAEDAAQPERVRGMAIFALGQQRESGAAGVGYLESLFARLDRDALREKVLQAVSERHDAAAASWLLDVARDASQAERVRKQAVFWAGQGSASTRDIAALYDGFAATGSRAVREHTIFTLSQRDDEAATTKLIDIARTDADPEMRRKALFWLAQKDDPRVTRLIADLVTRE